MFVLGPVARARELNEEYKLTDHAAAAASAGKRVTSLGAPRGAGEDQPLDPAFPEGNYLSVCVVRVG